MIKKPKIKNQKSKSQFKIKKGFKNFAFWFVILIFAFCILNFNCYAQPISSAELINNAKEYDGKTVICQGEVIGEVMRRGDYAWVNAHDGKNALGIWLPEELTRTMSYAGDYKHIGDIVKVKGIFQRACSEHGGDLDIHAQAMQVVERGVLRPEAASSGKKRLVLILSGGLCLILILRQLKPA